MIVTTVGRKVYYRPSEFDISELGIVCFDNAPLDATVVAVHNDRLVNLVVFDAIGLMSRRVDIQLLQDDDAAPVGQSYAEWMPYQTAQSKKEVSV